MISFTSIKNRFTRRAPIELGTTVRNLTRSFANSPSPDRAPQVVRYLDRARNEAEEAIVYMDNVRSAYPVANDDDDQDEKYDNPPAYKNRQEARGRSCEAFILALSPLIRPSSVAVHTSST